MHLRLAGAADAARIARLHVDSWRRHYPGAYSDAFLDGDVETDRREVWSERLRAPDPARSATIVAEQGDSLVGFVHVIFDDDPAWGALVDNVHVAFTSQRTGVGTSLMARAGGAVAERSPASGLYLWVLQQNTAAQAFYEARRPVRRARAGRGRGGRRRADQRLTAEAALRVARARRARALQLTAPPAPCAFRR